MYDFANSSYTTVITTVVYSVLFPKLIVGDAPTYRTGNLLWSVTLSIGYGLAVVSLPFLGALIDRTGHKKRWLLISTLLTVTATAALYLATPGSVALAMVLVIISSFGFSIGESFIATFLPDLGEKEDLGRISGLAWGLGYVGGIGATAIVLFGLGPVEPENFDALRYVGPVTAVWFTIASIPTFLFLREPPPPRRDTEEGLFTASFGQLRTTVRELSRFRDLALFFVSYCAAMAGLSIVISFAFVYGDQVIGWSASTQAAMFVLTNLSASIGAVLFGYVQGRLGDKNTYMLTLAVWIVAVLGIWGTPNIVRMVRSLAGAEISAEQVFLGVGCVAGLCLGATQSAGRTIVALFSPAEKEGEMFGLWGVFGKLAAIFGLLSLGILQAHLGLQNSILLTAVFFAGGLAVAFFVDEAQGIASATSD